MKKLLLFILLLTTILVVAQEDKTVTLTVSGTGKTIEEAKTNALRSAIEQAFGAFISSKTEILNDNLIKDEIVSVANGNIQKFEIVSQVEIPNNGYAMTLNATVSISKLTSFAQSKGVSIEIKGGLFAANIIQQELNEKAELKAVQNIIEISEGILKKSFDYSIETKGNPTLKNGKYDIPLKIIVKVNKNFYQFRKYLVNSLYGLGMSEFEIANYEEIKKTIGQLIIRKDTINQEDMFFKKDFNENEETAFYYKKNKIYKINSQEEIDMLFGKKLFLDYNIPIYRIKKNDLGYNKIFLRNNSSFTYLIEKLNKMKNIILNFSINNNINSNLNKYNVNKINNNIFNVILDSKSTQRLAGAAEVYRESDDELALTLRNNKFNFPNLLSILPIKATYSLFIASFSQYKEQDTIATFDFIDSWNLEEIKQLSEYTIKPKESYNE
jgi:hypothetical protein